MARRTIIRPPKPTPNFVFKLNRFITAPVIRSGRGARHGSLHQTSKIYPYVVLCEAADKLRYSNPAPIAVRPSSSRIFVGSESRNLASLIGIEDMHQSMLQ